MPEKEGKDRMNWEYVYTNAQENEIVESAMNELVMLLNSKYVSDIKKDLFIPLSDTKIDGRRLVLENKVLAFEKDRNILQLRVEMDQWADLIKKFKVNPKRIKKIKKLIETSLNAELEE